MSHHATNISFLPADCLLHIFLSLPLKDVLNCRRVCKTWRKLLRTKSVWKNVSLEGLKIVNWKVATQRFKRWKTVAIDFSDHKKTEDYAITETTTELYIVTFKAQLRCLRYEIVTTQVFDCIVSMFRMLEVLCVKLLTTSETPPYSKGFVEYFDVGKLSKLEHLRELRIKLDDDHVSYSSFSFSGGLDALRNLKRLKILSLESLKNNISHDCSFLSNLTELVELKLGDAMALSPEVLQSLSNLPHLCRLSLCNGACTCNYYPCECQWMDTMSGFKNLVQLELEFMNIGRKLNGPLQEMNRLQKLTIIPLPRDFYPNAVYFSHEDLELCNILEVVDGLTQLRTLTWGVYCPLSAFDCSANNPCKLNCVSDKTGTLTAVKDKVQGCLPNTEIVILPVLTPPDENDGDD